ncbi:hypothetical protein CARUB_v10024784mg [Capsella rubella]|uniref:VQ domain-containing protein n=1 Tax=Capsella rubella TaxID=81985 RepID=R0FZM4_9BRAS|nr:calmodulin-binding protein 25 [Capsella rubella]EOA28567.1 hypothetical protein CARUB_v10024784mg [Capsella rubella]
MVTSDELTNLDSWLYRQGFNVDSWLLSDSFSHDDDLLARALHTTVTSSSTATPLLPSSFFDSAAVSHPSSTHTLSSNVSACGSDPDIIGGVAKRKRNCLLGEGRRATKRKSRASKKSQTTFITADPSNFRQMVQQVTGANYTHDSSSYGIFAPIVRPEPLRIVDKLPSDRSTAVPMLDTSAFLSNHHQENLAVGNTYSGTSGVGLPSSAKSIAAAVEFDTTNSTFPTLESWKVM